MAEMLIQWICQTSIFSVSRSRYRRMLWMKQNGWYVLVKHIKLQNKITVWEIIWTANTEHPKALTQEPNILLLLAALNARHSLLPLYSCFSLSRPLPPAFRKRVPALARNAAQYFDRSHRSVCSVLIVFGFIYSFWGGGGGAVISYLPWCQSIVKSNNMNQASPGKKRNGILQFGGGVARQWMEKSLRFITKATYLQAHVRSRIRPSAHPRSHIRAKNGNPNTKHKNKFDNFIFHMEANTRQRYAHTQSHTHNE